jgi:RNA-binding protein
MSQTQNVLDAATRRKLRRIAHHLHPIVSIGENGLTDGVVAETERALHDHELIKVRVHAGEREARQAIVEALIQRVHAIDVQRIGKVVVLYKKNLKPNEKLSNLKRFD